MEESRRVECPWIWLLVIVLSTFGVYAPSFWNDYTYDDRVFVKVPSTTNQLNEMVGDVQPVTDYWGAWYGEGVMQFGRGYRPLTVYSHALVQWWAQGIRPEVIGMIPARQRSVEVLPAPLGPTRPRISPAATCRESSSTAVNPS